MTDRDIVIRGIAGGKDLRTLKARDVMTKDIFWCLKEVRRMLILDRDKRLVGVVSIGDISKVEEKESGKALKDITEAA